VDKECKTAGGHASVDKNDELAQKLRGLTIDEVYTHAEAILKEPKADLMAKYAHLNTGMQRMNLGNRMRAAVMKVNAPVKPAKAAE
jgi:colicin import membrane protein